jgi:hypothetical protein
MASIYEIDRAITDCINIETGEVDAERLTELQMERDAKIENVAKWVLDMDGDAVKIDNEIKRLTAMKERIAKKQDSLKGYLRYALADTEFKGDTVRVKFRKSRAVGEITEDAMKNIPEEFIVEKTVTTRRPDKVKLKKAIDEGFQIAGVQIVTNVKVVIE